MGRFDFVGHRKTWFIVSAIVFVITVGSLVLQGLNLGIDFTGGLNLDLRFAHHLTADAIRRALDAQHYSNNLVTAVGNTGREFILSLPALSQHTRLAMEARLRHQLGGFTEVSVDTVTGVVSHQLVTNGILAVLVATVAIMLYMTFRFDFRFALSGIAAVFFDALISIGAISLTRIQITEAFVPAVLTIVGYSINDRIIIFDRIRENRGLAKRGDTTAAIANLSLNQTLGRSINTAVIVILAMLSILVFGGSSLRDFSATTAIGVFFGAYSSIFFASPLWVSWTERVERREAALLALEQQGKRPRRVVPDDEPTPSEAAVPATVRPKARPGSRRARGKGRRRR